MRNKYGKLDEITYKLHEGKIENCL